MGLRSRVVNSRLPAWVVIPVARVLCAFMGHDPCCRAGHHMPECMWCTKQVRPQPGEASGG
ncbi:MAG TPA: hypothetical protein VFM54_24440 [Micromonosporaceae bacterium]|nr:hypothetical protein [Micromonosporaceae bacterium]